MGRRRFTPDYQGSRERNAPKGWKPTMVRRFPEPSGRKRPVEVEWYVFGRHTHLDIKPRRNPVWHPSEGGWWVVFADDPEVQNDAHEPHHASFERQDRAMRWARQVLEEHFPAAAWAWVWPEDWAPSSLPDDPAEEAAVRTCPICRGPRSEHTVERRALCDGYLAEFKLAPQGTTMPVLPVALAGRDLPAAVSKQLKRAQAAAPAPATRKRRQVPVPCKVLVAGAGVVLTGTVGVDVVVLPNMRPDHVPLLQRARLLVVEAGGATVHLGQVAREMGVAVVLREDAVPRFPAGTVLTVELGTGAEGAAGTIRVERAPRG